MMTFLKQNMLFVVLALVALVGGGYYFLFMQPGAAPVLTSDTSSPESEQILQELSRLQGIELNDAVFKDPVYLSLTDYGVILTKEPAGRRNPFSPISFSTPANQVPLPGKK